MLTPLHSVIQEKSMNVSYLASMEYRRFTNYRMLLGLMSHGEKALRPLHFVFGGFCIKFCMHNVLSNRIVFAITEVTMSSMEP